MIKVLSKEDWWRQYLVQFKDKGIDNSKSEDIDKKHRHEQA